MTNGSSQVASRVTLSMPITMARSTRAARGWPKKEGEPEGSNIQNLGRAAIACRADYLSNEIKIAPKIALRVSFILNNAVVTH